MASTFIYPPPRDGKPFRLNMGLRSLDEAAWLESGDDLNAQIAERMALSTEAREIVYQQLPGYQAAISELVERITDNLKMFHSDNYSFEGSSITHKAIGATAQINATDALLQLATIIAEDLVVLSREESEWKIVAGAVLFPSRWKLSEKLGKGMDAVHAPVPGYQSALAPYMTATFDKITADRPVWRKNWSLHSTEDLHQPTSIHEVAKAEDYWWRTERQTLTRSREGDFLFFTIRNRAEPLSWIASDNEGAALFAETLASFSPETIEYKGLQRDHQEIINYLRLQS
jgi:dimethylamine monooxygenase subunit A